jgi:hypothetical protein
MKSSLAYGDGHDEGTQESLHVGANRSTLLTTTARIGPSSAKRWMTLDSQRKSGFCAPAAQPSSGISKYEETRIPTIPPMKPTSRNAKKFTCANRFGARVSFASSGMNSAVSARFAIPKSPGFRAGVCTIASLARWVVRLAQRTVSCFIPSAMTGFIIYVFPYPNRISFQEAFEVLEPDEGKLSCPVLRGPGLSNEVRLLDPAAPLLRKARNHAARVA